MYGEAFDIAGALTARLARPDRGENGYRHGVERIDRLEALERLCALARDESSRRFPAPERRGGVNTHVHTSKSFSCWRSPAEAVWHAFGAGIEVFGINDHYTVAGHDEFRRACEIAGIRPTFSLEAIALWSEAELAGETVNDPANPGRTYVTAKGVTRPLDSGSRAESDLRTMLRALRDRHERMTQALAAVVDEKLGRRDIFGFADVLALTPHDEPTERHVIQALALWLERTYREPDARQAAIERVVEEPVASSLLDDAAALQDFLRARLVKAGRIAYVAETRSAYISIERMVSLALELGAIPAYPVLGNPITAREADLPRLFDRLEELGFAAIEVIPDRNERARLAEIVNLADERSLPVFNGTEHNTPARGPLVDRYFFDDEFRSHFERGANVLLGHQELAQRGESGFVDRVGRVPGGDRARRILEVEEIGSLLRRPKAALLPDCPIC